MKIEIKKPDLTQTIQYLEELNPKQQAMLADEIRKIWLINQARKMDTITTTNDMTMDEIVAEVRAVRNAK